MYSENSIGPKIDPCGTPRASTSAWYLSILDSNKSCSTRSNVLLRSSSTESTSFLDSTTLSKPVIGEVQERSFTRMVWSISRLVSMNKIV